MRKIISLVLALILTMSVFAVTASADYGTLGSDATSSNNYGHSYTVKKASAPIIIDGQSSEWNNVSASEQFTPVYHSTSGTKPSSLSSHPTYTFKAMWYSDGASAYLYVLLESNDNTQPLVSNAVTYAQWASDTFQAVLDENGDKTNELALPAMYLNGRKQAEGSGVLGTPRFSYAVDNRQGQATNGGYTVEMCYKFKEKDNCSNTVNFDIGTTNRLSTDASNVYARYSWNGINNTGKEATGTLTISDESVTIPAQSIIATQKGAGMRVAQNIDATGLRFETRIDRVAYDSLIFAGATVKTGTLILPTDYLTSNSVEFTKAALDAKSVEYLDVVNTENAWASTEDGYYTFFGSITNIKEVNHDRAFSGVGYIEITYINSGVTEVFYGGYNKTDHSRDVKAVATAAYNSGDYSATALELLAIYAGITQQ